MPPAAVLDGEAPPQGGRPRRSEGYRRDMDHKLSRLMSAATTAYGAYAIAKPGHLADAMGATGSQRGAYDLLAPALGARDLAVGLAGLGGRSAETVRTAMRLRIAFDLGDAALLSVRADDPDVRRKVLAITVGWASLNAVALAVDSRRHPVR